MNFILLGPQGSGKGTQADLLAERYGLKHLSTGALFRELLEKADPTAQKIKKYADKGDLAPDSLILKLIKSNLGEDGTLFDGFPRTLEQAEALDEHVHIHLVIELRLSDEEAVKRIVERIECHKCGAIYGSEHPPKKKGVCDKCESKMTVRDDDKPDAIKKRLERYHDETEPLLEYYRPRHIVRSVDAGKKAEEVFKALCKVIDAH